MSGDNRLSGRQSQISKGWGYVARRTVLVCDNCGKEVGENKGAALRVTFTDARRGSKVADLCDDCAGEMPGRAAARRGRRPKSAPVIEARLKFGCGRDEAAAPVVPAQARACRL